MIHSRDRRVWIWVAVWAASRALIVAEIVRWASRHVYLQDVTRYEGWASFLTSHGAFPGGHGWQYPPGAGLLMLLPRLFPVNYGAAWVGLMVAVDFVGFLMVARLARRSGREAGVWVWLLGIPLLGIIPMLRFDLVPTVLAIGALVVIHRRPGWFGALAGLGAAIKLWPALLLLGEWDRRRLLRSVLAAAAVVALVFAGSAIAFGDVLGFLSNGGGRGLQEEAVGSIPWQLLRIVGHPYAREVRFGAWEIVAPGAGAVTDLLKAMTFVALVGAAAWWWFRAKAIRAGRTELATDAVSRDFVFAVVLLVVVTSQVLSPQYMVWLLGLAAVVLSAGPTRLRRPAWIVLAAAALSSHSLRSPGVILVRDLALLFAATDATLTMAGLLRAPEERSPGPVHSSSAGSVRPSKG